MSDDQVDTARYESTCWPHTLIRFVTHGGEEIRGCTCQAWQLDDADVIDGTVPEDLPRMADDFPNRLASVSAEVLRRDMGK